MAGISGDNHCYTMLDNIPFVGGPKDGTQLRHKKTGGGPVRGNRKTPIAWHSERGNGEYHKYVLELAAVEDGSTIDGRYVYQGIVRLTDNPRKEQA